MKPMLAEYGSRSRFVQSVFWWAQLNHRLLIHGRLRAPSTLIRCYYDPGMRLFWCYRRHMTISTTTTRLRLRKTLSPHDGLDVVQGLTQLRRTATAHGLITVGVKVYVEMVLLRVG